MNFHWRLGAIGVFYFILPGVLLKQTTSLLNRAIERPLRGEIILCEPSDHHLLKSDSSSELIQTKNT
jgi:hypothetical protein